ncbi:MAG: hypothetical protein RQ966_18045 [Acetobacteraceae bacterium]|nr:hypothetical protein [Acetobacteraceae bacterium]
MTVVVVAGGDLFRIALQYFGDATLWDRIAEANGLKDPILHGLTPLKIPALSPIVGGGIAK